MKANGASGSGSGSKWPHKLSPPPSIGRKRGHSHTFSSGAASTYPNALGFLSSLERVRINALKEQVITKIPAPLTEEEKILKDEIFFSFGATAFFFHSRNEFNQPLKGTPISKGEAALQIAERLCAKGAPWQMVLAALYSFFPLSDVQGVPEEAKQILISKHRILSYPFGPREGADNWNDGFIQRQSDIFFKLILLKELPEAVLLLGEEMLFFASHYQNSGGMPQKTREYLYKAWGPISKLLCFLNQEKAAAQLEVLTFPILLPNIAENLKTRIEAELGWKLEEQITLLKEIEAFLKKKLLEKFGDEGVLEISSRQKTLPKIHKRERRRLKGSEALHVQKGEGIPFSDILGIRVVVKDRDSCYAVATEISRLLAEKYSLQIEKKERWKDYIEVPKGHGQYRALHGIFSANKLNIEVQIRAKEDHSHAEIGMAAHWRRKLATLSRDLPYETNAPLERWYLNRGELQKTQEIVVGSEDGRWHVFRGGKKHNLLNLAFALGFGMGMYVEHNAYVKPWDGKGGEKRKTIPVSSPLEIGGVYFFDRAGFPIASQRRQQEAKHIPAARWAYFLHQFLPNLFSDSAPQDLQRYQRLGEKIYRSLRQQVMNAICGQMETEKLTFLQEGTIFAARMSDEQVLAEMGFSAREQAALVLGALTEKVAGKCVAADKLNELQEQIKRRMEKYVVGLAHRKNKEATAIKIFITNRPGIFRVVCRTIKGMGIEIKRAYSRKIGDGRHAVLTFVTEEGNGARITEKEDWRNTLLEELLENPPVFERPEGLQKETSRWRIHFKAEGTRQENYEKFFDWLDSLEANVEKAAILSLKGEAGGLEITAEISLPMYLTGKKARVTKKRLITLLKKAFEERTLISELELTAVNSSASRKKKKK